MKTALIVNPASGRGKALSLLPRVVAWCEKHKVEFKLLATSGPGDATRLARTARFDGCERIVVLGGDGTINETGQAIFNTNVTLGVLPGGSGNDFIKMISRSGKLDDHLKTAFFGKPHKIDVGLANGRPFLNATGIGFDAQVAAEAARIKWLSGKWVYLLAVLKVLKNFSSYQFDVEIDQMKSNQKATLICVGNGKSTGGGFFLTPQAKFDDELLDICIIEEIPKIKIFSYLPRALNGTHVRLPGVRIYRSRKIVIRSSEKFPVHIDGEIISEPLDKMEITLDRRKLNVAIGDQAP